MSRLVEGLARRLVEQETVPRRGFLTGRRASSGAEQPPRAGLAAQPSKAPRVPERSDLRAIHIAVMSSDARLKSQLIALVEALKTPALDGKFSSTANEALTRTRASVRKLHATIAKVQPDSSERSQMLACLAAYEQMLTDLEQLGQSTDQTRAAGLTAKIKRLEQKATADYDAVHAALGLPKAARPLSQPKAAR
jgi:hypothetical protein